MWRQRQIVPVMCAALLLFSVQAQAADPISEWNQLAVSLTLSPAAAQAPVQQCRTMAIVQVSVHDAVNAITGKYETYSSYPDVPASASPEAAAIAAAHEALTVLFPAQAAMLDIAFQASLTANAVPPSDPGLDFGRSVADAILQLRANDHAAEAQFDYTVPGAGLPGVWERLNGAPALLPGWGDVTPWVLRSADQFLPDAPPALTSDLYARDLNEIREIGAKTGSTRSAEQTSIAMFWRASPTAIWNEALKQALAARTFDLSQTAHVFALMYLVAADTSTACWEAKYVYNFWRPQRAIANADLDGNDETVGDPTWLPLLPTPPHPEYPSAHGCNSSSMAAVLQTTFGDNPGVMLSITLGGVTRNWQTFSQGVDEVVDARVYSGIHFRNSDEVGVRLGRQVAQFVMTHALRRPAGTWKR
ncbi:MAG: vanadium-dependent haloperoxidase [Acidobacteriota bacterium]